MLLDEELLRQFKEFLVASRTLKELSAKFSISQRTVFRYLSILKGRGHNVIRVGLTRPTKYMLDGKGNQ